MDEPIISDESLVFQSSFETHIFPNELGSVTIKQICWPDDDVMIVIPVEQISNVVRALQRAKKDLQE